MIRWLSLALVGVSVGVTVGSSTESITRGAEGRSVPEQSVEGRLSDHAALQERRQDGRLVVEGFPEAPSVIEMQRKGIVAEDPKRLVVMAVHVAG